MTSPRQPQEEADFVVARPGQTDFQIVESKRLSSWAHQSEQEFEAGLKVHVYARGKSWYVAFEGVDPIARVATKALAMKVARERAGVHGSRVVVHSVAAKRPAKEASPAS